MRGVGIAINRKYEKPRLTASSNGFHRFDRVALDAIIRERIAIQKCDSEHLGRQNLNLLLLQFQGTHSQEVRIPIGQME